MSNKSFEAIELALKDISSRTKKLIIVPEGVPLTNKKKSIVVLKHKFSIEDALALVGTIKHIGIVNAEQFSKTNLDKLINILTTTNNATVVRLNASPVSCKVFYPPPMVGEKYIYENYEYSYQQYFSLQWINPNKRNILCSQLGWGVRLIDDTRTDYESPLTTIKGYPVTNMSYLFYSNPKDTLNLVNWDTSKVTDMSNMFSYSQATSINGLNRFDTSKVTNMGYMFEHNNATSLDLSSFNTSKVKTMKFMFFCSKADSLSLKDFNTSNTTSMEWMFSGSPVSSLDLSSFDTSRVTSMSHMFSFSKMVNLGLTGFNTAKVKDMSGMFYCSKATNLDLSSFDTSNVTTMKKMFDGSLVTNLDLSSFNTAKVTDMNNMFTSSLITTIKAKTQTDADKYQIVACGNAFVI